MIPPKAIEIGWRDLAAAALSGLSLRPGPAAFEAFLPPGETVATLSVRSGFDLLLTALRYPRGSEVVVSAVTIADMGRILEEHGLVPVPVDMDMDTLSVSPEALRDRITDRTRAVVIAHVFGSRMSLDGIGAVAREHDLLLIEDCAQAFDGLRYAGAPGSDVVMFSFGPIKTLTCLAGGLMRVRSPRLRYDMARIHRTWPVQPNGAYLRRVLKYMGICTLLRPSIYGGFVRALGGRHQEVIKAAVRGFGGPDFFRKIRRRPSRALLATMARRLRHPRVEAIDQRRRRGEQVARWLAHARRPGAAAPYHSHWVFPVLVEDPDAAIARLRSIGVDASRGATSLTVLEPREGTDCPPPERARTTMSRVVFLPVHPEVPEPVVEQMVDVLEADLLARPAAVHHG